MASQRPRCCLTPCNAWRRRPKYKQWAQKPRQACSSSAMTATCPSPRQPSSCLRRTHAFPPPWPGVCCYHLPTLNHSPGNNTESCRQRFANRSNRFTANCRWYVHWKACCNLRRPAPTVNACCSARSMPCPAGLTTCAWNCAPAARMAQGWITSAVTRPVSCAG
ncbi:hypothetical protein D3C77_589840 [compost metagenome]